MPAPSDSSVATTTGVASGTDGTELASAQPPVMGHVDGVDQPPASSLTPSMTQLNDRPTDDQKPTQHENEAPIALQHNEDVFATSAVRPVGHPLLNVRSATLSTFDSPLYIMHTSNEPNSKRFILPIATQLITLYCTSADHNTSCPAGSHHYVRKNDVLIYLHTYGYMYDGGSLHVDISWAQSNSCADDDSGPSAGSATPPVGIDDGQHRGKGYWLRVMPMEDYLPVQPIDRPLLGSGHSISVAMDLVSKSSQLSNALLGGMQASAMGFPPTMRSVMAPSSVPMPPRQLPPPTNLPLQHSSTEPTAAVTTLITPSSMLHATFDISQMQKKLQGINQYAMPANANTTLVITPTSTQITSTTSTGPIATDGAAPPAKKRRLRKKLKPAKSIGEMLDRMAQFELARQQLKSKNKACRSLGYSKGTITSYARRIQAAMARGIDLHQLRQTKYRQLKKVLDAYAAGDGDGEGTVLHDGVGSKDWEEDGSETEESDDNESDGSEAEEEEDSKDQLPADNSAVGILASTALAGRNKPPQSSSHQGTSLHASSSHPGRTHSNSAASPSSQMKSPAARGVKKDKMPAAATSDINAADAVQTQKQLSTHSSGTPTSMPMLPFQMMGGNRQLSPIDMNHMVLNAQFANFQPQQQSGNTQQQFFNNPAALMAAQQAAFASSQRYYPAQQQQQMQAQFAAGMQPYGMMPQQTQGAAGNNNPFLSDPQKMFQLQLMQAQALQNAQSPSPYAFANQTPPGSSNNGQYYQQRPPFQ